MNIDRVTFAHIRIPLLEPFRISNGSIDEKDGILVGVASEGIVGWGEASPMSGSFYSSDTPESTWTDLMERVVPEMLKARPRSISEANSLLQRAGANPFARAGVETAFWDLEAKQRNIPLCQLLGGTRSEVDAGLAVGIYPTIGALLDAIRRHLADGYKRLKIKIQRGWDVEPLSAIREEFGDIPLMVDANCAYTRGDIDHLRALDDFDLMMVEQPLPKEDLEGHAGLQSTLRTPVCLDESAVDAETVERAIRLGSCRIVNIKIQRAGGLEESVRIHDVCADHGIPVWAGTMPELGVGSVQTLHLATLPNFLYPTDVQASLRWFVDDCVDPLIEADGGIIRIAPGPGNGYRIDEGKVKKFLLRREVISMTGGVH